MFIKYIRYTGKWVLKRRVGKTTIIVAKFDTYKEAAAHRKWMQTEVISAEPVKVKDSRYVFKSREYYETESKIQRVQFAEHYNKGVIYGRS